MSEAQKEQMISAVKAWAFPLLMAAFMALVQSQYTRLLDDMKLVTEYIQKAERTGAEAGKDIMYLNKKVEEHERWLEELDRTIFPRKKTIQ